MLFISVDRVFIVLCSFLCLLSFNIQFFRFHVSFTCIYHCDPWCGFISLFSLLRNATAHNHYTVFNFSSLVILDQCFVGSCILSFSKFLHYFHCNFFSTRYSFILHAFHVTFYFSFWIVWLFDIFWNKNVDRQYIEEYRKTFLFSVFAVFALEIQSMNGRNNI